MARANIVWDEDEHHIVNKGMTTFPDASAAAYLRRCVELEQVKIQKPQEVDLSPGALSKIREMFQSRALILAPEVEDDIDDELFADLLKQVNDEK